MKLVLRYGWMALLLADCGKAETPPPPTPPPAPSATKSSITGISEKKTSPDVCDLDEHERALLLRLRERREELDTRALDLDRREQEIQRVETELSSQIARLRELQRRIEWQAGVEHSEPEERAEQVKEFAAALKAMKPKRAAEILAEMDKNKARPIVRSLEPAYVSELLGKLKADQAAQLASLLVDAPSETRDTSKRTSAQRSAQKNKPSPSPASLKDEGAKTNQPSPSTKKATATEGSHGTTGP